MNAMVILLIAIVVLACGYIFYGGWLAKQWGIDPSRPTPANEMHDGVDYVPANLMFCSATTSPPLLEQALSMAPSRQLYLDGFPSCSGF